MDRHLNTVVALSNRVEELTEKNASLLSYVAMIKKDMKQLEEENERLKADLKELSKETWNYKNTNK